MRVDKLAGEAPSHFEFDSNLTITLFSGSGSMPNCPQCLKHFPTDRGVVAHLTQKTSKCNAWERGPILLPSSLDIPEEYSPSEHSSSAPSSPSHSLDLPSTQNDEDFEMDFLPDPPDAMDPFDDDQPDGEQQDGHPPAVSVALLTLLGLGSQVQFFQNASYVYDVGQTFLDRFAMDAYSYLRRSNLYYPFASHDDWQMASYLLQSDLSMAKIDKYLKLNLVRLFCHRLCIPHSVTIISGR